MFRSKLAKHLPHLLTLRKTSFKIALGAIFLSFFLNYQPTLGFPPIKQNLAQAQAPEQSQSIDVKVLPFKFQNPHDGYISTRFSFFHPGVDIATPLNTPIHPVAPGIVTDTGYNYWGLGQTVTVDHEDGFQSLYAHMGKVLVKKGDRVKEEDVLGEVGLTGHTSGPHTHLQVSKNGKEIDPETLLPILSDHPTI